MNSPFDEYKDIYEKSMKNVMKIYRYKANLTGYKRFIKEWLGEQKPIHIPENLASKFSVIYEATIKWFKPYMFYDTVVFHDKDRQVYIFFNVANPMKPKVLMAVTALDREKMGETMLNSVLDFVINYMDYRWL